MGRAEMIMTGAIALGLMSCDAAPTATISPTPTATAEPTPTATLEPYKVRARSVLSKFYPEIANEPGFESGDVFVDDYWELQLINFSGYQIGRNTLLGMVNLYRYFNSFRGRTLPIPGTDGLEMLLSQSPFRYQSLIVVDDSLPLPDWMDPELDREFIAGANLKGQDEAGIVMILPQVLNPEFPDETYDLLASYTLASTVCEATIDIQQPKNSTFEPSALSKYVCESLVLPLEARLVGQSYAEYLATIKIMNMNVDTGGKRLQLVPLTLKPEEYGRVPLIGDLFHWREHSAPRSFPVAPTQSA